MKTKHLLLAAAVLTMTACAAKRSATESRRREAADAAQLLRADTQAVRQHLRQRATSLSLADLSVQRSRTTEAVPARRATVSVTEENLRRLPDGAAFTARDGQLTLEARRDGDTLRFEARSDSLQRRSEYYEASSARLTRHLAALNDTLEMLRAAYDSLGRTTHVQQSEQTEQRSRSPSAWSRWLLLGFAAGVAAGWWIHKTNLFKQLTKNLFT